MDEQKLLLKEGKRGLRRTPKWIFMRIKTYSCKAQKYVYLARISKKMHMNRDVSVCLIPDTYVGMQSCTPAIGGDDVLARPAYIPMRCWAQHLRPDSTVWPYHTYRV